MADWQAVSPNSASLDCPTHTGTGIIPNSPAATRHSLTLPVLRPCPAGLRPQLKPSSGVPHLFPARLCGGPSIFSLPKFSPGLIRGRGLQEAGAGRVKWHPAPTRSCPGLQARAVRTTGASAHLHEAPKWVERAVQQQRGPTAATAQDQVPEKHLGLWHPLSGRTVRGAKLGSGGHCAGTVHPNTGQAAWLDRHPRTLGHPHKSSLTLTPVCTFHDFSCTLAETDFPELTLDPGACPQNPARTPWPRCTSPESCAYTLAPCSPSETVKHTWRVLCITPETAMHNSLPQLDTSNPAGITHPACTPTDSCLHPR